MPKKGDNATDKGSASARQVQQLKEMVSKLRARLEEEAKKRQLNVRFAEEARKARTKLVQEVGALREQGRKLAAQVQKVLSDSERREKARHDALEKVAQLRASLRARTDELRRKSGELASLARESARRARRAMHPAQAEAHAPTPPMKDEHDAAAETETSSSESTRNS